VSEIKSAGCDKKEADQGGDLCRMHEDHANATNGSGMPTGEVLARSAKAKAQPVHNFMTANASRVKTEDF